MKMVTTSFFLYPPPESVFVNAMTVIGTTILVMVGVMEMKGKHLQYSKFWQIGGGNTERKKKKKKNLEISSRKGMFVLYAPALVAASFVLFRHELTLRLSLLSASLAIHFLNRVLEVLFVHKYSGSMGIMSTIIISTSYFSGTATMIYAQYQTEYNLSSPSVNLIYPGIVVFLIGIVGNFYHHYLLANLRRKGERGYKIPTGGMFSLIICPHYFFECLVFVGFSCIAQTMYAFGFTLGTVIYLMGRSYATRNWYLSKFEDFPKNVKALVPYIF